MSRPNRRAWAKRALLWGVGAYAATSLAVDVTMDVKPHIRDRVNQPPRAGDQPIILMLGTSRTLMLGQPEFGLGDQWRVENYGRAYANVAMQVVRLERALAVTRPTAILLELGPPFFALPANHPVPPGFLSVKEAVRYGQYSDAGWYWRWLWSRVTPYSTFYSQLRSVAGEKLGRWSPLIGRPDEFESGEITPERRARALAVAESEYREMLSNWHVEPGWDRAARDLLALATASCKAVAVYTMPESPVFRTWYPPGVEGAARRYIEGLAASAGVPAWWCLDWLDDEMAFIDGHHLDTSGVKRVVERLGAEHIRSWAARIA